MQGNNQLNTIHDVIHQMEKIDQGLTNIELNNLKAFNTTYLIITKAVASRIGTGYFENDAEMQQFDIIFARYYFNALNGYTEKLDIAPSWKMLFDACMKNNLLQIQYMALGVNAHVNNDLAFSLYDMKNNNYKDYLKINDVISKCLPDVLQSLHEKNKMLEVAKNKLAPIYSLFLAFLIKNWRGNAWKNHLLLKENLRNAIRIKARAAKIADSLCILSSNKI
jgi:hypothetical protein